MAVKKEDNDKEGAVKSGRRELERER